MTVTTATKTRKLVRTANTFVDDNGRKSYPGLYGTTLGHISNIKWRLETIQIADDPDKLQQVLDIIQEIEDLDAMVDVLAEDRREMRRKAVKADA